MLPKRCKSIRALNIYYKMVGGLRGSDVGDEGACWGGNVTRDDSCAWISAATLVQNFDQAAQDLDCVVINTPTHSEKLFLSFYFCICTETPSGKWFD